jgi:hypothetical protein
MVDLQQNDHKILTTKQTWFIPLTEQKTILAQIYWNLR